MAQKEIELILLRQCASYLLMPIWLMDPEGELLYYNEPAEPILGRRFDEAGPMPGKELSSMFSTTAEDGSIIDADDLPINIALMKRKPAYLPMRITGLDGVSRMIEVTAFPITGQGNRNLGAVAIFWETESK
jgi:PAS domain-containing protein